MIEENKHRGFTKDGHLDENSIAECSEWLNDPARELSPDLQKHLENCSQCRSEVLEVSELIRVQPSKDTGIRDKFEETCAAKHSPSIQPGKEFRLWHAAAVIIVLISITVFALLVNPGKKGIEFAEQGAGDKQIEQSADTASEDVEELIKDESREIHVIPEEETENYAANYVPNEGLEALIGVKFRGRNDPVLTSPPTDTTMQKGFLQFIGRNPDQGKLELQVLNNKAEVIDRYPDITELNISVKIPEKPGLYYWKLSGEEELYLVGKIEVVKPVK